MDAESSANTAVPDTEPGAVTSAGDSEPGQPPREADRRNCRLIWSSLGLVSVARLLRSRRFQGQVITGAIALAALVGLARENQARILARLAAWDKQQQLRHQRGAKHK